MTLPAIPAVLRDLVFARARQRCEYCLVHQDVSIYSHHEAQSQSDPIFPSLTKGVLISVRPCTGAWGARETVPGTFCSQALQDGAPATEADTAAGAQQ